MTARSAGFWSGRVRYALSKRWVIAQASVAAGAAYWIAHDLLGHEDPFIAPLAAVVSLGTSYGQRVRRVIETTWGIGLGLILAAGVVHVVGAGVWQLVLVVALAIATALLLGGGALLISQAAVQAIVFVSVLPTAGAVPLRCIEAVVGGAVAIVAATLVPRTALRSSLDHVSTVAETVARLLRGSADRILHPDADACMQLLLEARSTDPQLADLRIAAAEGLSAIRASPFHRRERGSVRRVAELVDPLDLALRNTRVLVRRVTVAAVRQEPVPRQCALDCRLLADLVDSVARRLLDPGSPDPQPDLISFGRSLLPSVAAPEVEVVLGAQLRSIVADLLRLTGMTGLESTRTLGALPG